MRIPVIRGTIDRRILVNYHVDPRVLAPLLPAPFRPKLVHGLGMVGICLIRLKDIRPTFLPRWLGIGRAGGLCSISAHRILRSAGFNMTRRCWRIRIIPWYFGCRDLPTRPCEASNASWSTLVPPITQYRCATP